MNKPHNERNGAFPSVDGYELRFVSKRRMRKLRARYKRKGIELQWRECGFGPFYSWLRFLPRE